MGSLVLSAPAHALSFENGSFEQGVSNTGSGFTTLYGGDSTSLPSWIVTGRSIDYINSEWVASNGSKSLDLDGNLNAGGVTQTFDTIAGKSYQVNFDLAGNPEGEPTVKTLAVTAPNFSQNYSFDVTGHSFSSMGWTTKSFIFTASGSSSTLGFTSTTGSGYGPALDNVTVTQTNVPFEFSPEQGFILGIPLFLGLRTLKQIRSK